MNRACPFCGQYPLQVSDSDVEHTCPTLEMTIAVKCSTWNIRRHPAKTKRFNVDQTEMKLPVVRTPKQIQNDLLLCALASEELGKPVTTVVGQDAKRMAMALKVIRAYSNDVSVDEIRRRAELYRLRWPHIDFTANALAKWWNKMDAQAPTPKFASTPTDRAAQNKAQHRAEIDRLHRQYGFVP